MMARLSCAAAHITFPLFPCPGDELLFPSS